MADKSLIIPSFKYGLDTRREAIASLPGTLQTCENAFINSGGEIEKRKAFVNIGRIPLGVSGFRALGLQDTDTGVMVFSSDASPGGLPTNVVWQQLVYPKSTAPGSMATVLYSQAFNGKSFVLVNFDNEDATFAYYNGTLVHQITDGIVLTHPGGGGAPETISDLSQDLAAIVNGLDGWLAHSDVTANTPFDIDKVPPDPPEVGYRETTLLGSTLLMSPVGMHFTPVIENNNSALGKLGARLIDQNYPGVAAKSAYAVFTINAGTAGTLNPLAPYNVDGSSKLTLTNGPVTMAGITIPAFAILVANAVNNYSFLHGYTADVENTTITIFAPAEFGATFNGPASVPVGTSTVRLTVDCTGDVTTNGTGNPGTPFLVTLEASSGGPNLAVVVHVPNSTFKLYQVQGNVVASATGSNGTVKFTWTEIPPGDISILWGTNGNSGRPTSAEGPNCGFLSYLAPGQSAQASYNLQAKDATTTINKTVFVKLSCNVP